MGRVDLRNVCIATVVDERPPYVDEVAHLFESLEAFGGELRRARRRAYFVNDASAATEARLAGLGVEVRVVDEVEPRFRFANKLAMFAGEAGEGVELLVAVDSDVLVAGDFSAYLEPDLVQAKQPDGDLLTLEMWTRMFERFGLALPAERHPTSLEPGWTHAYFNTGVVVAPGSALQALHDRWLHFIRALLAADGGVPGLEEHLAERVPWHEGATAGGLEHLYFAEQWAFALARHDLGLPYAVLPLALNFPTPYDAGHRPGEYVCERFEPDAVRPLLLHHHHDLEAGLRRTGYAAPDAVIDRVNRRLFAGRARGAAFAGAES